MLKTLWLQLKGKIRQTVNENTDLRVAGQEHIHEITQDIESVRTQRNRVAGNHLLLLKQITASEILLQEAKDAYRHWNKEGDKVKEDRAYDLYTTEHSKLEDLKAQAANLQANVDKLDKDIISLESETNKAKTKLDTAASVQQVGRAKSAVESIHGNINKGPLAGAIEAAELMKATAEATQQERKGRDNSDVLNINAKGPLSREALLND